MELDLGQQVLGEAGHRGSPGPRPQPKFHSHSAQAPAQPTPHHGLAPRLRHTHPQRAWQLPYEAKTRKQPKRPAIENWFKKMCTHTHTHTHTLEYHSVTKRNKILLFAAIWMELENTILSEVSQRKTNII